MLPELKGFVDIHRLLAASGRGDSLPRPGGAGIGAHGGDEVLDDKAREALKARIRDLQEEIAEAEDHNDSGRTEPLRAEFDELVEALSSALGLGGRSRRLGSLAERARTTVTWRVRHAVKRMEAVAPRARAAPRATASGQEPSAPTIPSGRCLGCSVPSGAQAAGTPARIGRAGKSRRGQAARSEHRTCRRKARSGRDLRGRWCRRPDGDGCRCRTGSPLRARLRNPSPPCGATGRSGRPAERLKSVMTSKPEVGGRGEPAT